MFHNDELFSDTQISQTERKSYDVEFDARHRRRVIKTMTAMWPKQGTMRFHIHLVVFSQLWDICTPVVCYNTVQLSSSYSPFTSYSFLHEILLLSFVFLHTSLFRAMQANLDIPRHGDDAVKALEIILTSPQRLNAFETYLKRDAHHNHLIFLEKLRYLHYEEDVNAMTQDVQW